MVARGARGDEARAGHLRLVRDERRQVGHAQLRAPSAALVREWLEARFPPLDDDVDEWFDEDRVYDDFHMAIEHVAMAEPAASWVEATLGVTAGAAAQRVSVLLSGPSGADVEEELLDELGDDAVPALVWLTSGVVTRLRRRRRATRSR